MKNTHVMIEGSKYELVVHDNGDVRINRGDIVDWVVNPPGTKMLIAMAHELNDARILLEQLVNDFDPEKQAGPPCGPEMLDRIKKHFQVYLVSRESRWPR